MNVKREKIDNKVERRLLTAMITSDEFLSQASAVINPTLIDAAHVRRITEWCVEHWNQYRKAPRKDIQAIFESWSSEHEDSKEARPIQDLLDEVEDSYEDRDPLNVPYLLDQLRMFLERKSLEHLQDDVDNALHSGRSEEAKQRVLNYKPIELMASLGINPLTDHDAWERAFSMSALPLFEFPGDLGIFLNAALVRDGLVGLQAPEKRGKTWWCIEFAVRALKERRKVAFFQVGDLSEHQVMIRLGMYWAQRPSRQDLCGTIDVPYEIEKPPPRESEEGEGEEQGPSVKTKSRTFDKPLTKQACIKACQKLMRGCGMNPQKTYIKVSVHPNSSVNVRGITAILDRWEMVEDFIPDVIVIDYADILAPEDPRMAPRDQVNETWKALRRLSQERHCLVIAPTQANASSYDAHTQTMRNFSEDKRKLAHVTGMIGLNQTEAEKTVGVMRLNWIVLRESPFNTKRCLWVGQCLPIGRAFYCATL